MTGDKCNTTLTTYINLLQNNLLQMRLLYIMTPHCGHSSITYRATICTARKTTREVSEEHKVDNESTNIENCNVESPASKISNAAPVTSVHKRFLSSRAVSNLTTGCVDALETYGSINAEAIRRYQTQGG